jgi:hypothetical protein
MTRFFLFFFFWFGNSLILKWGTRRRICNFHCSVFGSGRLGPITILCNGFPFCRLHTGTHHNKVKSYLTIDGGSASVSWYRATIRGPRPIFISLPWKIFSDTCSFLLVRRPPSREDGSVIYLYNCYWTLQALSLLGSSPAGLVTTSHCLIWD